MTNFLKFLKENIWAIGLVLVNVFYFLPKTIKWIFWNYLGDEGYGGLFVAVNYVFHIFFVFSFFSLIGKINMGYRLYSLIVLALIAILSIVFAFRDIPVFLCSFLLIYLLVFYKLYKQIRAESVNFHFLTRLELFGFFISIIWIVLDKFLILH